MTKFDQQLKKALKLQVEPKVDPRIINRAYNKYQAKKWFGHPFFDFIFVLFIYVWLRVGIIIVQEFITLVSERSADLFLIITKSIEFVTCFMADNLVLISWFVVVALLLELIKFMFSKIYTGTFIKPLVH